MDNVLQVQEGSTASSSVERYASNAIWAEALRKVGTAITPLNIAGEGTPIYWVHSVTGLGTDPVRLAKCLSSSRPFYSIRVPSKYRTPDFAKSIPAIAAYYAEEIARLQPHGPLIIGGWSAGVVIALELAQQLQRAGRDVRHLVALDFAPRNSGIRPNPITFFGIRMINWLRRETQKSLSPVQFVRQVMAKTRNTTHDAMTTEHPLDQLIATLGFTETEGAFVRQLHDTAEVYPPERYTGSVLFYVGVEGDGKTTASNRNLAARHMVKIWRHLAPALTVKTVNGDHEALMKGDAVEDFARQLDRDLAADC